MIGTPAWEGEKWAWERRRTSASGPLGRRKRGAVPTTRHVDTGANTGASPVRQRRACCMFAGALLPGKLGCARRNSGRAAVVWRAAAFCNVVGAVPAQLANYLMPVSIVRGGRQFTNLDTVVSFCRQCVLVGADTLRVVRRGLASNSETHCIGNDSVPVC